MLRYSLMTFKVQREIQLEQAFPRGAEKFCLLYFITISMFFDNVPSSCHDLVRRNFSSKWFLSLICILCAV